MAETGFQRSGLPLLFLAAFVLAVAAGVVILLVSPFADGFFPSAAAESSAGQPQPAPPEPPAPEETPAATDITPPPEPAAEAPPEPTAEALPEPAAEALPEPAAGPAPESAPSSYVVVAGDTLFDLAARYWSDPYLWPVLLVRNSQTVSDPDFLRQGSRLQIGDRPDDVRAVTAAHIEAYRRYRRLGDETLARGRRDESYWFVQLGLMRINKAHWVLYSGLRYDRSYLDTASDIPAADLEIVRAYIRRYGGPPGT